MKNWTLFLAAVLLATVGLSLTANDDRDGEKRERRDNDRIERDKPRDGDRDKHAGNELKRWARQQKHKAHKLLEAGRKEEAHKLMSHVEEVIAKRRKNNDRHAHEERARHIHQAIEHLKAAGLEEFAEELAAHLHQRHDEERREHHREKREQHGDRELEELRNHVRELSHALREIQERLENRRDR